MNNPNVTPLHALLYLVGAATLIGFAGMIVKAILAAAFGVDMSWV